MFFLLCLVGFLWVEIDRDNDYFIESLIFLALILPHLIINVLLLIPYVNLLTRGEKNINFSNNYNLQFLFVIIGIFFYTLFFTYGYSSNSREISSIGNLRALSPTSEKNDLDTNDKYSILTEIVAEVNKECPKTLDNVTRIDSCTEVPTDYAVNYNYTLFKTKKSTIDLPAFEKAVRENFVNNSKRNTKFSEFKKRKINIIYTYYDKDARLILSLFFKYDQY